VDGIFDLLMPLALGGCVETRKGAPVSLWSATPARLAERLLAGELGGARAVRAFGERLGKSLRERLRAAGVERVLDSFSSAPAGVRPAEGLAGQILGRLDAPAPDGAAGELWLGGEALARGYRGEPDRTAERFAPDPFGREPGARRARTGDLARRRPGGGLELWGPAGPQGVSPRLDVVEELLEEHPRVVRAAAVFQEDGNGPRLVAHAWTEAGGPEPGELRELLRERLPETRVPWQLTVLGELPLTPAGRLDPEGLPRVEVRTEAAGAAPRTEVERMLVEIWSELLGVGEVGIHDNFFQLGGNSLLATRVVARINEVFQLSLGVETLFRSPTVADLALATDEHLLVQLGDAGLESLLGEARRA
jgi:hypothetical protein